MTFEPPRPLRILHCPALVGGNAPELARAERRLGLHSTAVAFEESPFCYRADEILWKKSDGRLARERKRLGLLWRSLRDFDVIHFNFGRTILPMPPAGCLGRTRLARSILDRCRRWLAMKDLHLLKRAGKGIVVTFQGDDARQGDFCRAHYRITFADEVEGDYYAPGSDAQKRWNIRTFDRFADRIYAVNPDLLRVLPPRAEFLPYSHVDLEEWKSLPALGQRPGHRLRILHAPSHPGVKGTRFVKAALERLQREGHDFEFLLVENLPQEEARRVYQQADLLVDQLLAGWYGGVAVELMALGKPVICYLRDEDLDLVPPSLRADLPIVRATPQTIYAVLRRCLTDRRQELPALGQRGRSFVEKWHSPLAIARRLQKDYEAIARRAKDTAHASSA